MIMKRLLSLTIISTLTFLHSHAQTNPELVHKEAMNLGVKGDFKKALEILTTAEKANPNSIILLKDIAYLHLLQNNYTTAILYSKKAIEHEEADEQAYQIAGSAYRLAKQFSAGEDVYIKGITAFPKSAILYAELGALLSDNDRPDKAITMWEKGISIDPNISNNYYFLAKAYAKKENPIRAILYAECFINMENKTQRTVEMRKLLLNQYTMLFASRNNFNKYENNNKNNFEKSIISSYAKFINIIEGYINIESLTAVRTQFLIDWFQNNKDKEFPFALFDRSRQMLKSGIYDAYNRWIFSVTNPNIFKSWAKMNEGQIKEFERYFSSSILKFTPEQHLLVYIH